MVEHNSNHTNINQALETLQKAQSGKEIASLLANDAMNMSQQEHRRFLNRLTTKANKFLFFNSRTPWQRLDHSLRAEAIYQLLQKTGYEAQQAIKVLANHQPELFRNQMHKLIHAQHESAISKQLLRQYYELNQNPDIVNMRPLEIPQAAQDKAKASERAILEAQKNQFNSPEFHQLSQDLPRLPYLTIVYEGQTLYEGNPATTWQRHHQTEFAEADEQTKLNFFKKELCNEQDEVYTAIMKTYNQQLTPSLVMAAHQDYQDKTGFTDNPYVCRQTDRKLAVEVTDANHITYTQTRNMELFQAEDRAQGHTLAECGYADYDLENGKYDTSNCVFTVDPEASRVLMDLTADQSSAPKLFQAEHQLAIPQQQKQTDQQPKPPSSSM